MTTFTPSYTEDLVYVATLDRQVVRALSVTPGVYSSVKNSLEVVAPGSGLQVNVKPGTAVIRETKEAEFNAFDGYYLVTTSESSPFNSVEVSTLNPQIAQIILRVYDVNRLKTSGNSFARLEWLNGTPSGAATKENMEFLSYSGAASLPEASIRLAYVLVPKNATKATEYFIQDARQGPRIWRPLSLETNVTKAEALSGAPQCRFFQNRIDLRGSVQTTKAIAAEENVLKIPKFEYYEGVPEVKRIAIAISPVGAESNKIEWVSGSVTGGELFFDSIIAKEKYIRLGNIRVDVT